MANEIHIQPSNPEAARAEIERTRARMSETIDEIEEVILRKKEHLQDRFDLRVRMREKPLHAAGIVLGSGLLLGFLTGGGSDRRGHGLDEAERAALWEARARRLLAIAREQEEEIDELEAVLTDMAASDHETHWNDDDYDEDDEGWDDAPSRLHDLRDVVVQRVGGFIVETGRSLLEGLRRHV